MGYSQQSCMSSGEHDLPTSSSHIGGDEEDGDSKCLLSQYLPSFLPPQAVISELALDLYKHLYDTSSQ
jgi:hypothetical protein